MIDYLLQYGLFLAQAVTVVISILFIFGGVFSIYGKGKSNKEDHIEVKNLNDKFQGFMHSINRLSLSKDNYKKLVKLEKAKQKADKKNKKKSNSSPEKNRLFALNFDGDIKASAVDALREEITAILTVATSSDHVFIRLESSGGMVHSYGLAASQLQRIKQKSIPLTISVDKVAASGGYLMACVADKIIAAPFAIIGSIGVLAQIPNFNRLLKELNVDFEQFTAGKYKRTVTMFGENTEEEREKLKEELEVTHSLFQEFVLGNRRNLDMAEVATGEHWYGSKAMELNLVDELMTGDDYLLSMNQEFDIFEISYLIKKSIMEKFPITAMSKIKQILVGLGQRA